MKSENPTAAPSTLDSSLLVSVIAVSTSTFHGHEEELLAVASFLRSRYAFFEILLIGPVSEDSVDDLVERVGRIAPQVRILQADASDDFDRLAMHGYQQAIGDVVVLASVDELSFIELLPILEHLRGGENLVRLRHSRASAIERFSSFLIRSVTGLEVDTRFYRTLGLSRQLLSELLARPEEIHLFRFTARKLSGPQTVLEMERPRARNGLRLVLRRVDLVARLIATSAPRLLRFAGATCALLAVAALVSLVYVAAVWLLKRDIVEGWTTMISMLSVWMFVQLSATAILCLGLSRILDRQERSQTPRLVSELTVSDLFNSTGLLNVEAAHAEPREKV